MSNVKVVVAKGSARVEVEGPTEFVEKHLLDLLAHLSVIGSADEESEREEAENDADDASAGERKSLQRYLEEKAPTNSYEAIAVVVYFLAKFRGKPEVTADEIRRALLQGKFKPPSVMAQAMTDCRRRYGFVQPGTRKGFWKLTHDGEAKVELEMPSE